MTREELVQFVNERRQGVVASIGSGQRPQAALVGLVATDRGELVFDTSRGSRKYLNLTMREFVAVVVGWDDERTVQLEGTADVPTGEDGDRCREAYFAMFPDGRKRAESDTLVHFRIVPHWFRYCDYNSATFEVTDHVL